MRRPPLVAIVAAAAVAAAGAYVTRDLWRPGPELTFVDRAEPAGFRDLILAGAASGPGLAPLRAAAPPPADICAALFADPDAPRIGTGETLAVYFTDYRCPYCRILGALLIDRAAAGEITLIFKERPVLGPVSQAAARAALAAARQGAFLPAHERLVATPFAPTPAYVAELARSLGLDPDRMAADMADPAIAAQLARNASLADALGLEGTPGLVIGRTVAQRSVREGLLDAMIRAEARLGPPPCAALIPPDA